MINRTKEEKAKSDLIKLVEFVIGGDYFEEQKELTDRLKEFRSDKVICVYPQRVIEGRLTKYRAIIKVDNDELCELT